MKGTLSITELSAVSRLYQGLAVVKAGRRVKRLAIEYDLTILNDYGRVKTRVLEVSYVVYICLRLI